MVIGALILRLRAETSKRVLRIPTNSACITYSFDSELFKKKILEKVIPINHVIKKFWSESCRKNQKKTYKTAP